MDSAVAYFRGFFYLDEGKEEDVFEPPQQVNEAEVKSAKSVALGEAAPPTTTPSATTDDVESGNNRIHNIKKAYSFRRREGRSTLWDLFWSKTDNSSSVGNSSSNDYNGKSLLASSSSGSSLPLPSSPRDFTARTSDSYNSDTSSTHSSSGDDSSKERRGRNRNRREIMHMADQQQPHFQWMSHGKFWTILGILTTWAGFALAHQAFVSTQFVSLEEPLYVDPTFEEVTQVGMIHLQLCYNETHLENIHEELTGCTIHQLTAEEIDDTMFQTARSMAFLAVLLGGFVSIFMTTAVVWHSINLRPIGLGYLIAYFLQSFTFLFFDADLCTEHKCSLSQGGVFSAVASLCWILACIAAARMDSHKFQKNLEWVQATRGRSRSRSRSVSPQKRSTINKKHLERRTTDGTVPLSDESSDGDSPRQQQEAEDDAEMSIDTSWRRSSQSSGDKSPGHSGRSYSKRGGERRFASNGCEIIQGIQDLEAAHAWAAKSPKAKTSVSSSVSASTKPRHNKSVSPHKASRSKRPNLTIDTNDGNSSLVSSHMSSTAYSIGSPIQPPSRKHQFSIRPMPSPSKRLDHTGDIQRSPSPSKSGRSSMTARSATNFAESPMSLSAAEDIISTPSSASSPSQSSASVRKKRIQRELDALDTLVEGATPRQQLWNHPSSTGSSPGVSPSSDAGVFLFEKEPEPSPRKSRHSSRHSSSRTTPASVRSSSKRSSQTTTPSSGFSSQQSSQHSSRTTTEEHRARRSIVFDFLEEKDSEDGYDLKERQSRRSSRA